MSERQVRLLYRTTCHTCGDDIVAGTVLWWDDDRRHATCTECAAELDPEHVGHHGRATARSAARRTASTTATGSATATVTPPADERARRRQAVLRARARAEAANARTASRRAAV